MNVDHGHPPQQWSHGLCSCVEDKSTCFITWCFPCVTFGQIAEIVDEGQHSCLYHGIVYGFLMTISCQWVYSCMYRKKLRKKFGLPEEPCTDCGVHYCCESFALCQEHAELKSRGFDPSKGWNGSPTAAPQVPPSMTK